MLQEPLTTSIGSMQKQSKQNAKEITSPPQISFEFKVLGIPLSII